MPEYDVDIVTKEWLQSELRSLSQSLIVLDCRSSNEFQEGHIRSAVNFSIPSLILKRLATGKIDVTSTIKCRDLKQRIQNAYNDSLFVLYTETIPRVASATTTQSASTMTAAASANNSNNEFIGGKNSNGGRFGAHGPTFSAHGVQRISIDGDGGGSASTNAPQSANLSGNISREKCTFQKCTFAVVAADNDTTTINVLHRRLKQDGCRVYCLKGM